MQVPPYQNFRSRYLVETLKCLPRIGRGVGFGSFNETSKKGECILTQQHNQPDGSETGGIRCCPGKLESSVDGHGLWQIGFFKAAQVN